MEIASLALGIGVVALLFSLYLASNIVKKDQGTERMRKYPKRSKRALWPFSAVSTRPCGICHYRHRYPRSSDQLANGCILPVWSHLFRGDRLYRDVHSSAR